MLGHILNGFIEIFDFMPILMILIGTPIGILIGVLPGLSPSIGVALLLPATYGLDPLSALVLLVTVYLTSNYGGSITAIAINTPGTPGAVATTFDGYKLTQQGKPGHALFTSLFASTIGGLVGTVVLMTLSLPLARIALSFESYEYCAMGVFGLSIISSLSSDSPLKGFLASVLGLLLVTIGFDAELPFSRFTFGIAELSDGITFIPALIGLFALGEVFISVENMFSGKSSSRCGSSFSTSRPPLKSMWNIRKTIIKSSFIGTLIGSIPGAGGTIATFIAYNSAKNGSKKPEEFGKGSLEGVAAPESANNASVGGALIPLLALGIPGSASTAVLIGALMIHDISPGPELFQKNAGMVYGIYASLFVANIAMFAFGLMGNKLWTKIISAPNRMLYPVIIALSFLGSYFVERSIFDVGICITFGVLGWILKRASIPTAPVVLGLILGKMIENNLRISLQKGTLMDFASRPLTVALLVLAVLSFVIPYVKPYFESRFIKK